MIPCSLPPCDVVMAELATSPAVLVPVAGDIDVTPPDFFAQADLEPSSGFDPVPEVEAVPSETAPEIEAEDLGEIRIVQPEAAKPAQPPTARLLVQSSAYASTNITGLDEPSTGGYPLATGATLLLTPSLGPSTRVVASAGAGLTRFPDRGSSNYDVLDFSVGLQQQFSDEMYGRLAWDNRQLYRAGSGENLASTNAVNFTVGRQDQFSDRLRLDSFYDLQARFVSPDDFSRLTNSLGANLRYALSPQVETLVGYQLSLEDYTQVVRFDTTHRLRAGIHYRPAADVFLSGIATYLLGSSSEDEVSLDNLSIGFSVGLNLSLF